ncbi:hypothetical protein BDN67DRAFT_981285 [Paxillus ammoniavirescens]|nr:hypothetical protein BDN67DRAFT_981285 [Paxillus ammoniavirescens]
MLQHNTVPQFSLAVPPTLLSIDQAEELAISYLSAVELHRQTLALQEPAPETLKISPGAHTADWERGVVYAKAQNLARTFSPHGISREHHYSHERVKKELRGLANVEVLVRDEAWAAEKAMARWITTFLRFTDNRDRTFLFVTKGTSEPAEFLEM